MVETSFEIRRPLQETYIEQIDAVLNRPLSPENIDTFADDALDRLVTVVGEAVSSYGNLPTIRYGNGVDSESAAFSYFGMNKIESLLDHVAQKSDQIHALEGLIQGAAVYSGVIIPPVAAQRVQEGSGSFERKKQVKRTKTTLFLLENEYGIDVNDQSQLTIFSGQLTPGMMRQASYHLIEVPSLNRSILVCDEEGNRTFVFDTESLGAAGIHQDKLLTLSKPEIDYLLADQPDTGRAIRYSENFVTNMLNAIDDPRTSGEELVQERVVTIRPQAEKPPEGYLSRSGTASKLGTDNKYIASLIAEIDPEIFGDVQIFKFGPNSVPGYSPEQQELIKLAGEAKGAFAPKMPDGYISLRDFAKSVGISRKTVSDVFESIDLEELGPVELYRNKKVVPVIALSPDQQLTLKANMERRGLFLSRAPEGYLVALKVAKMLGVDRSTIESTAKSIESDELGKLEKFRFLGTVGIGYSPEQIDQIRNKLEERGAFISEAKQGYISMTEFRNQNNVTHGLVNKALAQTDSDELKELEYFKFEGSGILGLNVRQQQLLLSELKQIGAYDVHAPKDYLSIVGFAHKMKVGTETVEKAIAAINPEELGDLTKYRFKTKTTIGISPDQQEQIVNALYESGLLAPVPPDGYLSRFGIVRSLGSNNSMVEKAITELESDGKLEPVREFRFPKAPRPYRGYSPRDQEVIKQWLIKRGVTIKH